MAGRIHKMIPVHSAFVVTNIALLVANKLDILFIIHAQVHTSSPGKFINIEREMCVICG